MNNFDHLFTETFPEPVEDYLPGDRIIYRGREAIIRRVGRRRLFIAIPGLHGLVAIPARQVEGLA